MVSECANPAAPSVWASLGGRRSCPLIEIKPTVAELAQAVRRSETLRQQDRTVEAQCRPSAGQPVLTSAWCRTAAGRILFWPGNAHLLFGSGAVRDSCAALIRSTRRP